MKILPKHKRGLPPSMAKKAEAPGPTVRITKPPKEQGKDFHQHDEGVHVRRARQRKRRK